MSFPSLSDQGLALRSLTNLYKWIPNTKTN